jgi:hypothetical protein
VLVADAGWDVELMGFDLAAFGEQTINSVSVFNDVPFPFLTPTNYIGDPATNVLLPDGGRTSLTASNFNVASLTSQVIWLRIDHNNVPDGIGGALIGLDNVKFRQVQNLNNGEPTVDPDEEFGDRADVPEPAMIWLALLGGSGAVLNSIRRRRRSA